LQEGSIVVSSFRKRIAAGLATATIAMLGSATVTYTSASAASPDTSPVPCGSSLVWLRLDSTTGEHCYTGNGTAGVNLSIHLMQIIGYHAVCLNLVTPRSTCYLGNRIIVFSPPLSVKSVTISTP
jgi:hypothetical protein